MNESWTLESPSTLLNLRDGAWHLLASPVISGNPASASDLRLLRSCFRKEIKPLAQVDGGFTSRQTCRPAHEAALLRLARGSGGGSGEANRRRVVPRPILPRHSMYAVYAYIGVVLGVNVGIYGIHGVSGVEWGLS